ncbi:MAG: hypothetical protein EXQ52_02735 [Bryobacterales bacterium]|nr:hypothetical protein [Bryobacterales bacterium]
MGIRNQNKPAFLTRATGSISIQFLVIMVPVVFGLMGFAIDLGRLYLVRGELNQAAASMALAAAARLNGTAVAADDATLAARLTIDDAGGHGNKYNFGSLVIGASGGTLASEAPDPSYYATAADAIGEDQNSGASTSAGTEAKHVRVDLNAEAPLTFWGFLTLGQSRKTSIAGRASAGMSAPVCTACGIDPLVIAAIDLDDTVDFGFAAGTLYTLGYQCNGGPAPQLLAGTTARVPYLLIDRFDDTSIQEEGQQLYRIGAQGLLPNSTPAKACVTIASTDGEQIWGAVNGGTLTSAPRACNQNMQQAVTDVLCGIYTRLDQNVTAPAACSVVTDVDTLAATYTADRDVTSLEDYTAYTGNARRVMIFPVVDALNGAGAMTVLGFRQFLLQPNPNDVVTNPADANGRFIGLYIGNKVPLKQGGFSGSCGVTSGPGKVVLLQ